MMAAMMGASLSVGMITEIAISDFPREIVDLLDYITPMEEPWYQDGLRFRCTRCGNCCTGAPGFVWVEPEEIDAIAEFKGESLAHFEGLYTRLVLASGACAKKPTAIACFTIARRAAPSIPSGP